MHEVYTCICGGQIWTICGAIIACDKCGKEYGLMWLDDEMENPKDFNERIRKAEGKPQDTPLYASLRR